MNAMLLDPKTTAKQADLIFNEFIGSQFGKEVIETAKQIHPEYKSDPGYDTTGEAVDFILGKIENNHCSDFDLYRDPVYKPKNLVTTAEFNDVDYSGASVKYHLSMKLDELLLN